MKFNEIIFSATIRKFSTPQVWFTSYCENIDSNSSVKEVYPIDSETERELKFICGVSSPSKIKMKFGSSFTNDDGLGLPKNSILSDLMQDVTLKLFEAGILQHLKKLRHELAYPINPEEPEDNRRVFSMKDLGYGFEIWLIACGVSTAAFLIELLVYWMPKMWGEIFEFTRMIIELITLLRWLSQHRV